MGNIGEDKTRVIVTLPKELKVTLSEIAKEENRSLTNLIVTILKDFIKSRR
jgi:metal-responsive CopG/Arc/MetJ family transcriptional regulator